MTLVPTRICRDASVIGEEVIKLLLNAHDVGLTITLEIAAHLPEGADEKTVRTVTENCSSLKFLNFGFERY
ncbi:MAG: hypothetical protein IH600_16050 [Bacteroidetes bacterium]|nr:hypothetical protein [Bacteroidota bacterium]